MIVVYRKPFPVVVAEIAGGSQKKSTRKRHLFLTSALGFRLGQDCFAPLSRVMKFLLFSGDLLVRKLLSQERQ